MWKACIAGVLVAALLAPASVAATEFNFGSSMSSDAFRVLDAQHGAFGGTASASSSTFRLVAAIGDLAIGSSSATTLALRDGFLYFPKVTAPVLNTATAGNAQVALSWTAAQASQGWTIASYNVCTKPSGGSYTCENVGAVTSSTKTGLTNGTTYTFKIEAKDGVGNVIAVSGELNATPAAPSDGGGGGGAGGGGGGLPTGTGTIIIKGIAYASSTVTIRLDSAIVSVVRADAGARFDVTLNSVAAGTRRVDLFTEDAHGRRSVPSIFTVTLAANSTVTLSDVYLSPTIDLSSFRVQRGDILRIFGQTAPLSEINVHVATNEIVTKTNADSTGGYGINFNTRPLIEASHFAKSRAILTPLISPFSEVLQFTVGRGGRACDRRGDLNRDCKVNITDFSILLFWWNTKQQRGLDIADLNRDRKVNITDLSILLFNWTG